MATKFLMIENEGEIEPLLIELLGASTKREDERTIGTFGSGAKFSVIEALRKGIKIYIASQDWFLTFETKDESAGEQTFKRIVMKFKKKDKRMKSISTSYTLSAAKNWDETWYIIREWVANAMDAEIETEVPMSMSIVSRHGFAPKNKTRVFIEFTDEVAKIVKQIDQYMKTSDVKPIHENAYGKIYERVSSGTRVFHRGMLVAKYDDDGLFDYSLSSIDLTEERTPRYPWQVFSKIAYLLTEAPPEIRSRIMNRITSGRDSFESKIDFEYVEKKKWAKIFEEEYPDAVIKPDVEEAEEVLKVKGYNPVDVSKNRTMFNLLRVSGVRTADKVLGYSPAEITVLKTIPESVRTKIEEAQGVLEPHFPGLRDRIEVILYEKKDSSADHSGVKLVGNPVKIGINNDRVDSSVREFAILLLRGYVEVKHKAEDTFTWDVSKTILELAMDLIYEIGYIKGVNNG